MVDDALLVTGQTVSLRGLVTQKLRVAIVTGRFLPGQPLRERELCALTGVSRPSLREALRQLEAEGLVTNSPHRGLTVTSLTSDEARQVYAFRQVMETVAARDFARLRGPEDVAALKSFIRRLDELETEADALVALNEGTEFYTRLAKGSGNIYMAEALITLHNRIALIRYILLHQPRRNARSFATLRALAQAIVDGDARLAERLAADHVEAAARMAETVIKAGYRLPEPAGTADRPH